jgi:hypothetical protein
MRQALRAQGKLKVLMTIMNYNDAGSNNFQIMVTQALTP